MRAAYSRAATRTGAARRRRVWAAARRAGLRGVLALSGPGPAAHAPDPAHRTPSIRPPRSTQDDRTPS